MQTTLAMKLSYQNTPPIIFCADIDGTIFTAGLKLPLAPFWNLQTAQILRKNSIPFILVTGRSGWSSLEDREICLHGFPKADIIITSAGSVIYQRLSNGVLEKDLEWEQKITEVPIDKTAYKTTILSYFKERGISIKERMDTPHLLRFFLPKVNTSILFQIKKALENVLPQNIQIIFTDKLLYHNTEKIFSGDMLVAPRIAGKDNAIKYLLEKMARGVEVYVFGDALIDVPMLALTSKNKYTIHSFLVHPTPLAKKEMEENKQVTILDSEGPQAILSVLKEALSQLSPAQNSMVRKIIFPFEGMLDRIVNKRLTPNEISFLGLQKIKKGIDHIYGQTSLLTKLRGLIDYTFGLLCDSLDGIRARQSGKKEANGQLVDGFCDRAEEFYQLMKRHDYYSLTTREKFYHPNSSSLPLKSPTSIFHPQSSAVFAALSCVLPSIARAQVEIQNIAVPEVDRSGGSRSSRVRKLFVSLLMDIFSAHSKSEAIAQKIYSSNMRTFKNRFAYIPYTKYHIPNTKNLSNFQLEALERFLLYVQIFKEEINIVEKKTSLHNLQAWIKENDLQDYLNIDIEKERKRLRFKDYHLSLKGFMMESLDLSIQDF